MAIKKTATGKVDKRTKEYKAMCANLAKARKVQGHKSTSSSSSSTGTRKTTAAGKVDKRTKEYKTMCANLAKARKKKNSLGNRLKRLFSF